MDTPKKILFLITKSNWGGAQRYVYDLATNLPRDRFEAVVAGGGDEALFAKLRASGVRTILVAGLQRNVGITNEWRVFREVVRLLKKERPDVVHLNSSKAAGLGAAAAFLLRISCFSPTWKRGFQVLGNPVSKFSPLVIFTVHGWPFNEDRPFYQRAAIFLTSWLTAVLCHSVILVSKADWKTGIKFLPKKKLRLIPNGLAPVDFLARADARAFFAEKIGSPIADDTVLIGAIAELTKNKGISYLIKAFSVWRLSLHSNNYNYGGLASIVALVMGEGENYKKLLEQIKQAGLQDTIFLPGFIPDASRFLPGLDIFVLPSIKEGLPYTVMEAMAAGLPVVATCVGGVPDLITGGENGILVEPKDPYGLAEALGRLAVSSRARSDLSERARQKIATQFSFSAMMKRTISLYSHPHDPAPPLE